MICLNYSNLSDFDLLRKQMLDLHYVTLLTELKASASGSQSNPQLIGIYSCNTSSLVRSCTLGTWWKMVVTRH